MKVKLIFFILLLSNIVFAQNGIQKTTYLIDDNLNLLTEELIYVEVSKDRAHQIGIDRVLIENDKTYHLVRGNIHRVLDLNSFELVPGKTNKYELILNGDTTAIEENQLAQLYNNPFFTSGALGNIQVNTRLKSHINKNPFSTELKGGLKQISLKDFNKVINHRNKLEVAYENGDSLILEEAIKIYKSNIIDIALEINGEYSKDSDACFVLKEGQSISVLEDKSYTIGRQGFCSGRSNINGDNFIVLGLVTSYIGCEVDGNIYTPTSEDFEIQIEGPFKIGKLKGGAFMVFAITFD